MSNKLHFYTKYSKEKIKISDKPFASGGEGAIYAIASPRHYSHLVAKIYYPEKRTEDREAKMHYLMQHPPITFQKGQPPSIGWVQDVIYKEQRFLGILLIKIEGKKLTKLTLAKLPRRADKAWQRFAFKDPDSLKLRLRTCFNLAVVIYQIHEKGQYVLVDLKPDNILMQPNGLLAVVDMDSVEVIEDGKAIFAAPVATPEYTPPEHYIGSRTVIEETWDRFSLGVIFYQLLLGLHPFAASAHPPYDNLVSIHDKIQHNLYVHHPDKQEFLKVIPPPHKRYAELPIQVQELFQNCFAAGAENPFSRPSALDWCSTLAELLNLPFKGIPKYELPHKVLPKIDFQASTSYFLPNPLPIKSDAVPEYSSFKITSIDLNEIKISIPPLIEKTSPSIVLQTAQKKLWDEMKTGYKKALKKHRINLFKAVCILTPIFVLSFFFNWFIALGFAVLLTLFPELILRSSKEVIRSIGKIVLPTSMDDILSKQQELLDSNKPYNLALQALESKRKIAGQELNQLLAETKKDASEHLEQVKLNDKSFVLIQQKISAQKIQLDSLASLNESKQLELQLKETRAKELKAYETEYKKYAKQFSKQLNEKKVAIKGTFSDFSNKKFKLKKAINLQQGKLQTIKNKTVKQQLHIDYTNALEANKLHFAEALTAYREKNQKPLPIEIQFSKPLRELEQQFKIQLKYNKRRLQSTLKKAKKELGKNFQTNLAPYLDLLYKSGDATELHFAHKRVKEQFDLLKKEVSILNLEEALQLELSDLFASEALIKWGITPKLYISSLLQLENNQNGMSTEWFSIEKELKNLKNQIELLKTKLSYADDHYFISSLEEMKTSILKIKASQDTYHNFQKSFYNDSKIAKIHKTLQHYQKTILFKQNLEADYNKQVIVLNQRKASSEERIRLNKALELYQENSILEERKIAQEITLAYEQKLIDLERKWTLEIEVVQEQLQKDEEKLAQLSIDFQSFQDRIKAPTFKLEAEQAYSESLKTTQRKFDTLYKDYKATYKDKTDLLNKNLEDFFENKDLLDKQIKQHRIQQLKNADYIFAHNKNLERLRSMEKEIKTLDKNIAHYKQKIEHTNKEKIKIDTLIQWQETYSTKIYIKDLLLNKIEQFKEEDDKRN